MSSPRTANWAFINPTTPSSSAISRICSRNSSWIFLPSEYGGNGAGRVAGVHAGLLDMLHQAADQHVLAIADGVHVHLDGVVQEAVQQHGRVVGSP